jgi:2'-5' RNA ligase
VVGTGGGAGGNKVRLFVAIELVKSVKDALQSVQGRLQEFSRDVRWARPEQMHLTLKFLGDTREEQVEAVCAAAGEVAAQVAPFEMSLVGCGCFPPRGAVRIVQCGVADQTQSLPRCAELCEQAFFELGFAKERRPFKPHLTIGRVRDDRTQGRLRAAVEAAECQSVSQQVDAIFVVQSELRPSGARYTNVVRHELSG